MNQYESEGKKITTYVVIAENVEFGESKANANAGGNDTKLLVIRLWKLLILKNFILEMIV